MTADHETPSKQNCAAMTTERADIWHYADKESPIHPAHRHAFHLLSHPKETGRERVVLQTDILVPHCHRDTQPEILIRRIDTGTVAPPSRHLFAVDNSHRMRISASCVKASLTTSSDRSRAKHIPIRVYIAD